MNTNTPNYMTLSQLDSAARMSGGSVFLTPYEELTAEKLVPTSVPLTNFLRSYSSLMQMPVIALESTMPNSFIAYLDIPFEMFYGLTDEGKEQEKTL